MREFISPPELSEEELKAYKKVKAAVEFGGDEVFGARGCGRSCYAAAAAMCGRSCVGCVADAAPTP